MKSQATTQGADDDGEVGLFDDPSGAMQAWAGGWTQYSLLHRLAGAIDGLRL